MIWTGDHDAIAWCSGDADGVIQRSNDVRKARRQSDGANRRRGRSLGHRGLGRAERNRRPLDKIGASHAGAPGGPPNLLVVAAQGQTDRLVKRPAIDCGNAPFSGQTVHARSGVHSRQAGGWRSLPVVSDAGPRRRLITSRQCGKQEQSGRLSQSHARSLRGASASVVVIPPRNQCRPQVRSANAPRSLQNEPGGTDRPRLSAGSI